MKTEVDQKTNNNIIEQQLSFDDSNPMNHKSNIITTFENKEEHSNVTNNNINSKNIFLTDKIKDDNEIILDKKNNTKEGIYMNNLIVELKD